MVIALAIAGRAYMDNRIPRCTRTAATKSDFGGYCAISAGWLLHTAWDVLHHVWELPKVRWIPTFFDRVSQIPYWHCGCYVVPQ